MLFTDGGTLNFVANNFGSKSFCGGRFWFDEWGAAGDIPYARLPPFAGLFTAKIPKNNFRKIYNIYFNRNVIFCHFLILKSIFVCRRAEENSFNSLIEFRVIKGAH